jgi:hypothetical protein
MAQRFRATGDADGTALPCDGRRRWCPATGDDDGTAVPCDGRRRWHSGAVRQATQQPVGGSGAVQRATQQSPWGSGASTGPLHLCPQLRAMADVNVDTQLDWRRRWRRGAVRRATQQRLGGSGASTDPPHLRLRPLLFQAASQALAMLARALHTV